ncbi:ribose ABC transporter ATP-binding protein RbsA [Halosimplex carlsbadense 2-9-1]|uniref:Ribose ABC transporter ATP-binding protein RbsA n=1 Tax=Halosimplex carlsbadense 2-9-1 TaxID=797114 RepID=M0CI14_9EURY|nr:ABC transporter ATP-binding protein [Halosimplex carlsbadense]ELZ22283.1 ribose ABC transporter ATP-binding protein RbsA [Halosimplex carlsbadense 2-9-1]
MDEDPFLRMSGVRKEFPGVVANDDVDFSVRRGEIHGLLGENGAGKSTLMKVLYGLYDADAGSVHLGGEPLDLDSPQDAIDRGIGMVHQHFKLIPRLSVAENVVLGEREPAGPFRERRGTEGDADGTDGAGDTGGWLPDAVRTNRVARALAERFTIGLDASAADIEALADDYGFDIDVRAPVAELDVGERQRVEILKALYRDVDLLILDEPTAVLTPAEAERLFETLRTLADSGISVIFITHKLAEATAITDRVTVLREGETVGTVETGSVDQAELARLMVGREVLFSLDKERVEPGDPVLDASGLRAEDDRGIEALSGIDLSVRAGEIVGIAGVSGNGQRELAEALAGVRDPTAGTIAVDGRDLTGEPARSFVDGGVSFVPEDRHEYGCAEELSVMHNAALKELRDDRFDDGPFLDYDELERYAEEIVDEFDVRGVHDVSEVPAGDLSGGNLQKLILGRELVRDPDLLVAHQPTRGVDVGAIEFLREAILDQRAEGTGTVLISEDLDELFDLSDRLLVIYEGEIVHETTPEAADRERVGMRMTGGVDDEASAAGASGDADSDTADRAMTDGGGVGADGDATERSGGDRR